MVIILKSLWSTVTKEAFKKLIVLFTIKKYLPTTTPYHRAWSTHGCVNNSRLSARESDQDAKQGQAVT